MMIDNWWEYTEIECKIEITSSYLYYVFIIFLVIHDRRRRGRLLYK